MLGIYRAGTQVLGSRVIFGSTELVSRCYTDSSSEIYKTVRDTAFKYIVCWNGVGPDGRGLLQSAIAAFVR
jgi:hypothetical protein